VVVVGTVLAGVVDGTIRPLPPEPVAGGVDAPAPRVDDDRRDDDAAEGGATARVVVVVDSWADAPPGSCDRALANWCAPAPPPAPPLPVTRLGLPVVTTRSAIRANDTARMTHQLGRPRPARARRPSVVPIP
jgi:hypothetical protein